MVNSAGRPFVEVFDRQCSAVSTRHSCSHYTSHTSLLHTHYSLYIGVGVGIPVVILIVVGVILCYCCCVRYQNRKMQALIVTYNARRRNRDENAETLLSGPPPYEPLDEETEDKDPELPTYTESDPYAINSPPVAEQSRPEERQEPEESGPTGADSQSTGSDQDSHDHDQQILEDVPLIDESSA